VHLLTSIDVYSFSVHLNYWSLLYQLAKYLRKLAYFELLLFSSKINARYSPRRSQCYCWFTLKRSIFENYYWPLAIPYMAIAKTYWSARTTYLSLIIVSTVVFGS